MQGRAHLQRLDMGFRHWTQERMYIRTLNIANLRCFRKVAGMGFQYPGRESAPGDLPIPSLPNVTLLLGNNGAGKSTILKAIAMALVSPVLRDAGFRPYSLVRQVFAKAPGRLPQNCRVEAGVVLTEQDGFKQATPDRVFVNLERKGDSDSIRETTPDEGHWAEMYKDNSPAFLVLGYGASRSIAPKQENISSRLKDTQLRFQRVRGLFDDSSSLVPLAHWFPSFSNAGRKKQAISLIDELLGGNYGFRGEVLNGEIVFDRGKAKVPLPALSDGYRAFLGWIGDLLYHVCIWSASGRKLREIEGVVMVDEIDLHLHPEWQKTIIKTLSEAFPRIQFIFSSHSPLVTGSLEWPNIWVMREDGPVQLPDEPIHGLSADQVLTSPYFGIDTTRASEKVDLLQNLQARAQHGEEGAADEYMRELSVGLEARKFRVPESTAPAAAGDSKKRVGEWFERQSKLPEPKRGKKA